MTIKNKIIVKKVILAFLMIITISVFWRFINFDNRWTLSQDQARDALIAKYAISQKILPLAGPPSSAGPFSFGPIYYWLIMLFSSLNPNQANLPWIGFTIISTFTSGVMFLSGYLLAGLTLASVMGLITAFSSGLVFHSVDMLNPMPEPFLVSLVLLLIILTVKKKSLIFSILLGLMIALAINFHYQTVGLLVIPFLLFLNRSASINTKLYSFLLSLGTAFLIILIFYLISSQQTISTSSKLLDYFSTSLIGPSLNLNLLKEIISFWPKLWGEVLFFKPVYGYPIYGLTGIVIILAIVKKWSKPASWWIILVTLLFQAILLHFYQGAKMPVYLLFLYPMIIFLTAWVIWQVILYKRLIGYLILSLILIVSTISNLDIIKGYTQKPLIYQLKEQLDQSSSGPVILYSFEQSEMISLPIYFVYSSENRISDQGYKYGFCDSRGQPGFCPVSLTPIKKVSNFYVYNLNELDSQQTFDSGFNKITLEGIYTSTLR